MKKQSYKELQAELDEVLLSLQSDDIDIDEAMKLYKKGMKLTEQLKARLQEAENTVKNLTLEG